MNKIVREHYPASKLPDDLRSEFPAEASVKLTVEEERKPLSKDHAMALIARMQDENRGKGISIEDAVSEIRQLRDEWDD